MPHMIDADELFQKLRDRARSYDNTVRTMHQIAGEKAIAGQPITEEDKTYIAIHKAKAKEIDEIIVIMQRMAGV